MALICTAIPRAGRSAFVNEGRLSKKVRFRVSATDETGLARDL
jgi:hypothetical protein